MVPVSRFRQKLAWPVIVGFFGGGFLGLCYEGFKTAEPYTNQVRADDLRRPSGYAAEPAADVPASSLAANWRHADSRLLVVRVKGGAIDGARLESTRAQALRQLPNSTIDRAEVKPIADQQAVIVTASATRADGVVAHLRWAIVGGSQHATLVEQTSTSNTDDASVFESIVIHVANVMSQRRFGSGAMFDNWMLRGAMLGMILGAALARFQVQRRARAAASGNPGSPARSPESQTGP